MMEDWSEIFKEKLLAERPSLPEGDWAALEAMVRRRGRRKSLRWIAGVSAVAAAVAAILVVWPQGAEKGIQPPAILSEGATSVGTDATAGQSGQSGEADLAEQASKGLASRNMFAQVHKEEFPGASEKGASQEILPGNISPAPRDSASGPGTTEGQGGQAAVGQDEAAVASEGADNRAAVGQDEAAVASEGPDNRTTIGKAAAPEASWTDQGFVEDRTKAPFTDRLSMALSSGGSETIADLFSNNLDYGSLQPQQPPPGVTTIGYDHGQPLNVGLSLSYKLEEHLYLVSGLDYTRCKSKVTFSDKSKADQMAHYLGIPLHLDWAPLQGRRFSLYVGAGGEIRKCVYATMDGNRLKDSNAYPSFICLAGLRFEPVDRVGIFMEPQYSRTLLPESPAVKTSFTEEPDMLTFKIGLSFRWK